MHVPSLVKIAWHLLKLLSGNENMGVSRADNSVKIWRNLPISNPKPDLHDINAQNKFGENPLMFTRYHPETKYGRTDGRTDRWIYDWKTDTRKSKRENIIPCHYRGVGYKNNNNKIIIIMSWADNSVKSWWNLPFSNPIPDQCTYQVWWKSIKIYSSYCLVTKIPMSGGQMTVKKWQNLRICNPKPDLHNINAHIKFDENLLRLTQTIVL